MTERRSERWADPDLWESRVKAFRDYNSTGIKDAIKFSDWFAGNMGSLATQVSELLGQSHVGPLSNHIHINTQAALSELMFRCPRFVSQPQPQFGPPFGEKLARIETRLLNDWSDETDFFGEFRHTITDGLLSPMMIFEVGYSADATVDGELIEAERLHAQTEDFAMISGGKPKVGKDDYHPAHIEQHDRTIADIERGIIPAPAGVLRYLKKHRKFHEEACTEDGSRPLETVRHESIFGERVSMLCYAEDPGASTAARKRWVGKWFLRSITEVKGNKKYDAEARKNVQAADLADLGGRQMEQALKVSGADEIEDMALIFEGVDLQLGKKVLFSQGATKALIATDYRDARILPGGPYLTAQFAWDPNRNCGIAPPRIYEGHQIMVSYLDTLIAIAARRSVPMMAGVGNLLGQDEIDKIMSGIPAAFINLKKLPPGTKLDEVIQRVPVPEASDFNFNARMLHERGAERYSGIGSAKSGGGDFSKTATASAIVNDSVNNLSEDRRAIVDDFMGRIARQVMRLGRKWYTLAKVIEVAGIEAADGDGWPKAWPDRDIVRDKGVSVIPGSSRRKDAAVELKLSIELLSILAKMPTTPPELMVELTKRVMDNAGMYAVNTAGMEQAAQMAQIEQLLGGGQGAPGAGGPPSNPERRAKAPSEGTQAATNQGAQNVGGGRVLTGASEGDGPRMMR